MQKFEDLMDDDFNIPNVITLIYDILKQINKEKSSVRISVLYQTVMKILEILGIMPLFELTDDTLTLYKAWEQARQDKDFQRADQLRAKLSERGWI